MSNGLYIKGVVSHVVCNKYCAGSATSKAYCCGTVSYNAFTQIDGEHLTNIRAWKK